jgi:hypothetical protein
VNPQPAEVVAVREEPRVDGHATGVAVRIDAGHPGANPVGVEDVVPRRARRATLQSLAVLRAPPGSVTWLPIGRCGRIAREIAARADEVRRTGGRVDSVDGHLCAPLRVSVSVRRWRLSPVWAAVRHRARGAGARATRVALSGGTRARCSTRRGRTGDVSPTQGLGQPCRHVELRGSKRTCARCVAWRRGLAGRS